MGATIMSLYMIEQEINAELIKPLSPFIVDGSAYYLLSTQAFKENPRKLIFLNWLREEMHQTVSNMRLEHTKLH